MSLLYYRVLIKRHITKIYCWFLGGRPERIMFHEFHLGKDLRYECFELCPWKQNVHSYLQAPLFAAHIATIFYITHPVEGHKEAGSYPR